MTQADLYYKKMTETPVARLIVGLGIPTTISMLVTGIYNLADTYFVGALGESQLFLLLAVKRQRAMIVLSLPPFLSLFHPLI